ncbi:M56 family metallopeptidase [Erythrobacter sp. sf7]|uniref:M56 family metallopeptidase n=1 Tax=Erythrobacter fulvus TaxID=2987523 RepID=A0ABT5JL73_9SPHN|nr:M56 family metallopeptidase [Erythrobacter fulvus]MDC8753482.1 M56 family metallopeptidase [Erythrobacter fulvus]
MSAVMMETLAWTGVLIAIVLLLRRPVARWCGPQCAYALWALPLIRLVLPPLTLPAWMAPAKPAPAPATDPAVWQAEAIVVAPQPEPGFDLFALIDGLPLVEAVLLVWLGGAGMFLCRRFAAYFTLREHLLARGREMGRIPGRLGAIRLVETPGTNAPLAFGVLDRVIALPPGFMALHDRRARDLALAHEVAHHRGGDLLINILVQPLFALHWFNPLGHYGWLALRRDQEAACDARVIARADADERAAYARLIAGFAAGPNLALAAPMACPVLGEKSIIQRLRSLSMSHLSARRRMAGRALLGLGVLALPLTASISYAASEAQVEAPAPPRPPVPPAPPAAPDAPEPPEAPPAPDAPGKVSTFVFIDPDSEAADGEKKTTTVTVTETVQIGPDGKERRNRIVRRAGPDGEVVTEDLRPSEGLTWEGREAMVIELRKGLADADKAHAEAREALRKGLAEAEAARAEAGKQRVVVKIECDREQNIANVEEGKDGTRTITICQRKNMAAALKGIEQARDEIARSRDLSEDTRKRILKQLDRQIEAWKDAEG